jgi:predicted MFS family arabinose efflux permease
MLTSRESVDAWPATATSRPPPRRPLPDGSVTHHLDRRRQHGSLPSPHRAARSLPAAGSNRSSLRRPLIMLAIGTFAIGTDAFVIGGMLPAVARSLDVSTSSAGLLVTAFAVAYALGAPVLAVLGAGLARRALLGSALALFVAANVIAAAAPSYAVVLIARVLAALAAAAFVPAASAVASSLAPTEYRGRALATVVSGMTVAQVVGVPFGALVGATLGWRYTFIFIAAVGAAAALAVALWLPTVQSPAPASLRRRLSLAARPSTWPLLLQTTLAMAAGFSVLTYIGPVLSQAGGYHGAMISMALLVFGIASVAGSTLGGRLTDRFGAFPVVVGGLTTLTLAMLAISVASAASVGWPTLVALATWGLGGWTFPPSQQHRLVTTAPEDASVALGLNSSAIYAGAAIGGLVGSLALPAGAALVPAIAAGLAACALISATAQHHLAPKAGLADSGVCGPQTEHSPLADKAEHVIPPPGPLEADPAEHLVDPIRALRPGQ